MRRAAWAVNAFTVAKLLPLAVLVAVGLFRIDRTVLDTQQVANPPWTGAVLLLVFGFGGFESGDYEEIDAALALFPVAVLLGNDSTSGHDDVNVIAQQGLEVLPFFPSNLRE